MGVLSPRSVTTTKEEFDKEEMPSFLVSLVVEMIGYPAGLACMVVSQAWRAHCERLFGGELAELRSVRSCQAEYLGLPASTKSTISIAFSPDRERFASTHGDHTVKVVDFSSGRVVATLAGHPRTPWTVKFHPIDGDVVASGCLGFEARVWRVETETCVCRTQFERAIISLSFHPSGDCLAVAAGTSIYLWHYALGCAPQREFSHPHPVRCLRFLSGDRLVVGAANGAPVTDENGAPVADEARRPRATFQLMVCDVDVEAARQLVTARRRFDATEGLRDHRRRRKTYIDPPLLPPVAGTGRAIIREPRCVLRHALFYNDGGFDVAPDGSFICSCAELWVPDDASDDDDDDDLGSRAPSAGTVPQDAALSPQWSRTCSALPNATPPSQTQRAWASSIDNEAVAPPGFCGIMTTFRDDHRSRRARSVSSLDDANDDRASLSSSDSDRAISPCRRRFRHRLAVDTPPPPPRRHQQYRRLPLFEHQGAARHTNFRLPAFATAGPAAAGGPMSAPADATPPLMTLAGLLASSVASDDETPRARRRRREDYDDVDTADRPSATAEQFPPLMSRWASTPRRWSSTPRRGDKDESKRQRHAHPSRGKYQPHLVVVSLREREADDSEGKLLQAVALDDHSFSGTGADTTVSDIVTSVKLSPTAAHVLMGHSRGGDGTAGDGVPRVVSVVYRVGDMARIHTRKQVGDDVNIARFHPVPGAGIVYGASIWSFVLLRVCRRHEARPYLQDHPSVSLLP